MNVEDVLKTLIWKLQSDFESEGSSIKTGGSREHGHVVPDISPFFCLQNTRSKIEIILNQAGLNWNIYSK